MSTKTPDESNVCTRTAVVDKAWVTATVVVEEKDNVPVALDVDDPMPKIVRTEDVEVGTYLVPSPTAK
jgi:hypothetical protein